MNTPQDIDERNTFIKEKLVGTWGGYIDICREKESYPIFMVITYYDEFLTAKFYTENMIGCSSTTNVYMIPGKIIFECIFDGYTYKNFTRGYQITAVRLYFDENQVKKELHGMYFEYLGFSKYINFRLFSPEIAASFEEEQNINYNQKNAMID